MARFVLTAQLQLQAPNNVSQVVKQIQGQLKGINIDIQARNAEKATKQINNLTSATNTAEKSAKRLGSTFEASVRRFSAIAIATRAVSLFTNTLSNSIREAIDFERELVKISQVTGKTIDQLSFLTKTVTNLSTSLGVSSTSLINVSRILSQAGLSAQETRIALGTLARTELAPTFDDISETAEGAIAIFNQFRAGAAALEAQLGAVNAVAGQFAVEAGDLISVVRRTGGVFKAAGGDLNELIALFTSVRSTTRESAESIATGLRTIFTRIQRPKTIEFLKQYGIELLDLEGKFVGPYEAVRRLSAALEGLEAGDITFVKIAEELGGFRQIGKVIPLLQQFSVAEEALAVATAGVNSLSEDQIKAQQSLAVQIQKVQEQFAALIRNVTNTSTFQALAKTLLDLASAFIKIADTLAPVIPLLASFAAIKFASNLGNIGSLFGGFGGKKFAQGGKVHAFASGGMVPGTGNRDTVPAMLTPGEFVIKKSSVAKLGAGNLAAMNENRYAKGSSGTGVPKTAIQKGAQVGGVGIFDSDMIGAGAKDILTQIRSANKPYEVIHGPAGSGKTTLAAKRFGNNFIKSAADIDKYGRFVVLSGAGETKAGGLSPAASSLFSGASKITALAPSPEEVMSRRENRLATGAMDKRSEGALQGTLKAPTSFNKELYTQFSNVELLQKFADGGKAQGKPEKNFGKIGFRSTTGGNLTATYLGDKGRSGMVSANYNNGIYTVGLSRATSGYGPMLYDVVMELATSLGSMLAPDRNQVSKDAQRVWEYYFNNRNDVTKHPLDPSQWTKNQSLIDPKLYGKKETWPPKTDPAWVLQSGYKKPQRIITDPNRAINLNDPKYADFIRQSQMSYMQPAQKKNLGGIIQRYKDGTSGTGVLTPEEIAKKQAVRQASNERFVEREKGKTVGSISINPSSIGGFFLTPDKGTDRDQGVRRVVSIPGNQQYPAGKYSLTGQIDGFYTGKNDIATGGIARIVSEETRNGLKNSINSAVSRIRSDKLVDVPPIDGNEKIFSSSMSNLFKAGGAQETIEGYMLEGIVSAMTGATLSGGQATFDYPSSSLTGAAKKRLGNLFGSSGQINSLVKADAKRTGSPDSFSSITNKLISDLQDGNFEGVTVKKFATGGSVGSGTDTVPALLTPGEFVINKKSAQKIGYGSLNRMNKVGKYAKGGVVAKKVQAFADGGEVGTSSTQVSIDVEPVNQALQSLGSQAFLTTETMTQVAQALSNLGITTNKVSESKIRELYSSGKITAENAKSQVAILKESTQRLKNIKTSLKLEQQDMRTKRALGLLEKSAKDASDSIDKMGDKSDSDTQSPDNKDGLSATMKMNAGLMALSTAFSVLAPTIDETSTYTDHLLNNFSQLAIQASTAAMIIGNFKDVIPLDSLKQLGSAFSSAKSKVASFLGQSAASEAKEAAANKIVTKTEMDEAKANVLSGKSESMKGSGGMGGIGKGGGMAGIGKAGMTLGTGLMAAATATAVVAAGFYAVYNAQAEYSKQLKDAAIEAGNAEEASKRGGEEVAANQMATRGTTGAISGGVVGGAIGAIFGPIGIAVGAAIGALVGGLIAIFMPLTAAEKAAIEAAKARAAADALASKAAKALAEQNDAVSEAMKGFESGTLGVYDVIKASSDAMATAAASRKAAEEAQIKGIQESTAYYYSITGTLRRILSWLGLVSSPEDIMQPSLDEDKKRVDEARKAEVNAIKGNTGLTVLMKQVAAAGGGFDDFLRILEGMGDEGKRQADIIRNNGDAFKLLSQRMENLSKEAERTRKAFDAMNLGFHGVNAAAGAVTHALDNYLGAQEAGNIKLTRSIATLEAGVTSAAMGMDPAVFQDALNDAGSTLAGLGATQDQINKFKQNMSAINQAQVTFAKSSQDAKNKMVADFKRGVGNAGSLEAKKQVLADSVVMNLGPDVPKEVKSRISDAIMAGKLSEDDMQKIMDGNFEPLSKVLGELGKQTLDQVLPALKQQAEALKKTLALRAQILKLEQAYIDARKRTIDVEMEAASIKEEFGGPAVTTQQKESAILRQANLDSEGLGVGSLQAGSAAELTKSNAAIQNELNRIAKVRNDVATGSVDERVLTGEAGMNLDNREERLNKLAQSNYETTKKLIDLKRQEIKVIQARNKAEKDAMKSLMAGDIEAFLDKQAAIAAGAAIAIGDVQGAQRFGSSAIGGAFQNFEDMQAAGVQDYFGQKIGGRGGLLEQTGTAFGFGKNQAQVLAGSTQEEETLKAEARALADTLPQTAKIQENSAKQGLINAHLQYDAAKLQMEAAKARVAKATSKEAPKKAVVTQTEDTKVEQEQPIKKNKPAPSPISVALAKAIDAATGKTKAQDKLAENTSFVSPSEQARQQAEANKVATTSPAPIPMSGDAARAAQESQTDSAATQAAADSAAPPIQSVAVSGADKQASGASSAAQAPAFDSALFTTLSGSLDKNSQSMTSLTSALSALSSGIELKGSKMVDGAVNNFGQHIDKFTTTVKSLESLSLKVNVGNSNVSVTITEPAFLRELTQNLKSDILTEVQKKLDSLKLNQDGTTNTKSQSGLPT